MSTGSQVGVGLPGLAHGLARASALVLAAIARGREQGWIVGDPHGPSLEAGDGETSLDGLRRQLGLSASQLDVVWLLVGCELDPRLRALVGHVVGDRPGITMGALLAVVYPSAAGLGLDELGPRGALVRSALIDAHPADSDGALHARRVRICDRVLDLAVGKSHLDPTLDDVAHIVPGSAETLHDLMLPDGTLDLVKRAADAVVPGGGILLITGAGGCGKRTLLAATSAAYGSRALLIASAKLPDDRDRLRVCLRSIARECAVLGLVPVFCDLEALARTGERPDLLDVFEDELHARTVFATSAHPIARRWSRAPRIVEVPRLTGAARASLWRKTLPTVTTEDARILGALYPIAPALIVRASAHALREAGTNALAPPHIEGAIRTLLEDRFAGLATRISVSQTWDDLVLPDEQTTAVIEMLSRVRERSRVLEDWGFAAKVGRGVGVSALFSGPPGTGKTMAAGLVAKALKVEIFQVDLSKIVSKWIGETEKNLAALFDAAEAGHAMLLFDEADSLFGKRTEVRSSNDRYANQEVNYLLQRLEQFSGLCILTTNHETAIDEAFRRRLSLHVKFPMPELAERKLLWAAMLPPQAPIAGDVAFDVLAERFVMSGGYIRNAVLRAAYVAADEGSEIRGEHLARAAALEYEGMGRIHAG